MAMSFGSFVGLTWRNIRVRRPGLRDLACFPTHGAHDAQRKRAERAPSFAELNANQTVPDTKVPEWCWMVGGAACPTVPVWGRLSFVSKRSHLKKPTSRTHVIHFMCKDERGREEPPPGVINQNPCRTTNNARPTRT
eukprot:2315771-Prymnesium_polylepis.1